MNGVPFLWLTQDEDEMEIDSEDVIDNNASNLIKSTPLYSTIYQANNDDL